MKIKPLNDWAVVVPSEAEERTAGGLFIPDAAKEKPAEGVVEAIGPGALEEEKFGKKKKEQKDRKFIPTTVKSGERVLYEQFAGQKITIGNEERVLVRERDILGVLPPKPVVPKAELPPLQIPAVTGSPSRTALTTAAPKPAVKKAKKNAAKKVVKKAVKKTAAKPEKSSVRKPAAKKTGKKRRKT